MAWQIADRVKETTTSTGTGALTLAGAIAGYNPFSSIMGNGDTCFYALSAVNAGGVATGAFEIGIGTYATSGNTLTRTTILASSNAGAAVGWAYNVLVQDLMYGPSPSSWRAIVPMSGLKSASVSAG